MSNNKNKYNIKGEIFMATYTYKKCPHCGKTYDSYSSFNTSFHSFSGSPFLKCNYCGNTFVDTEIKEPALKPYKKSRHSILNCLLATYFPYGLMGTFMTFIGFQYFPPFNFMLGIAIILDIVYFVLTIIVLANRKSMQEEWKIKYEESVRRLSNPAYAKALEEAGFDVPEKYLQIK